MKNKRRLIFRILADAAAVCIWQAVAVYENNDILICTPYDVIKRFSALIFERDFWETVCFSSSRIVSGFLCAFFAGTIMGIAAGYVPWLETVLRPYMIVIRTVPVASFIILALVFLSGQQLSVFISFLMVLPVIYSNVLQGIKTTNQDLVIMAKTFHVPLHRRLLFLNFPSIQPFLISGSKSSLGLCWKAGIAAEVIAVSRGSVGEKLYDAKVFFATTDLLAWTLVIVLFSLAFEKVFLLLLKWGYDVLFKER